MIEQATIDDLKQIEMLMHEIKEEMREDNNPQWGSTDDDYPSTEILIKDINNNKMVKYTDDGVIKGVVTISNDNPREYDGLIENSNKKSFVLHRLAVPKEYRKQKVATKLFQYIIDTAIENKVKIIKASTEISNDSMNGFLLRHGFELKGTYEYDDYPGLYNYFEKEV